MAKHIFCNEIPGVFQELLGAHRYFQEKSGVIQLVSTHQNSENLAPPPLICTLAATPPKIAYALIPIWPPPKYFMDMLVNNHQLFHKENL